MGLTQEQLADKIHTSKQAVSNWERGMNYPAEDVRELLEKILGIKLHNETMDNSIHTSTFSVIKLKPLNEIDNMNDFTSAIDIIVKSVKLDSFEGAVRKMLYLTLSEVMAFEIYYQDHCRHYYSEYPLDWLSTAQDLQSLITDGDEWIIEGTKYPFLKRSVIAKKIEFMAYRIGGELFEDFDEDGFRNSFVQMAGRVGEGSGYDLLELLPKDGSDIMTVYKTAIFDIIDICSNQEE